MSSFAGHCIAALTTYAFPRLQARPPLWWGAVLVGIAAAPDIDYAIRGLRVETTAPPDQLSNAPCSTIRLCPVVDGRPARITHSLVGVLIVPALVLVLLWLTGRYREFFSVMCGQAIIAGLSHLVLDLLVDVAPMPLFWPMSYALYKLPFGILPSAPLLSLANLYFYRNLLIEIGILGPIGIILYWLKHTFNKSRLHNATIALLALISISFMARGYTLTR